MSTKPPINSALRQWTRGTSFCLTMGKTQVATLVSAHLSQGQGYPPVGHNHKLVRQFILAMHALEERGLMACHLWQAQERGDKKRRDALANAPTFGQKWQVTEAGEHVVALLKASGIYDEIAAELRAADAASTRGRVRLA